LPENFEQFTHLIKNFAVTVSQTIKSPTKLAQMMAGKAKLMADVIEKSLNYDDEQGKRSNIKAQMLSFQQMLIHDIDNKSFADIYSQTIAYGMFAARYHDPSLPTFSRMEASQLIPKSNPFLRKLFQDIAGYDLDTRLDWIVEELVTIFLASDVALIMKNFGKSTKQEDPVVHFYETFLGEYNPALRKARGVWYTPQPIVNFIVRAVDDILKSEFDLPQGLADTSKIKIKKKAVTQTKGANAKIKEVETEVEVHKVQILDPATGTGTFLAEVVRHIHKKFEGQQGIWSKYVANDLIPRLNGFELLMASYAMAHLKMDMLLTETGYKPTDDQRFRIFLTNSLEEAQPDAQTLFSSWLSEEADQANAIKRDAPVMVVIGNPPYSVSSTNKSKWIESLTADYKKDMKERNIQPLSDDYIKFIRFGQHFIDKNGSGILAYISNNSFIDGIIHRQMRKHLLESFDKIYILDLHGNAKKKEVCPDGSPDQNVFDIMQGVSINIFVKTGKKFPSSGGVSAGRGGSSESRDAQLAEVFHQDLQGKRDLKYNSLNEKTINSILWKILDYKSPEYFFIPKDNSVKIIYDKGFSVNDIFEKSSSGVQTEFDELATHTSRKKAETTLNDLKLLTPSDFALKYEFQSKLKKIEIAKNDVTTKNSTIQKIDYKIFNTQFCIYTGKTNGLMGRPRFEMMKNIISKDNLSICLLRSLVDTTNFSSVFISKNLVDKNLYGFQTSLFPLYLYPETTSQQSLSGFETLTGLELENENPIRTPNLKPEIVKQIAESLGLFFSPEKPDYNIQTEETSQLYPIDILDYIYAVLHSPSYREKYKEFLKIDFPCVPYPTDRKVFYKLVALGGELREIHLLESPVVEKYITQYPEDGDNIVRKPVYKEGNVYINETQYFANVPQLAWEFYIGGYQPAQKWLKDRKERELGYEDILHYQKIIAALSETDRIMKKIEKIEI